MHKFLKKNNSYLIVAYMAVMQGLILGACDPACRNWYYRIDMAGTRRA